MLFLPALLAFIEVLRNIIIQEFGADILAFRYDLNIVVHILYGLPGFS
jgi:hypothetical protein